MTCPGFEERLLEYGDLPEDERATVDVHLAGCGSCRAFLQALTEVDAGLSAALVHREPSPSSGKAILDRTSRALSVIPEALDLLGWSAMAAVAFLFLRTVAPGLVPDALTASAIGASLLALFHTWLAIRESVRN